jgi:phosphate transport system substrate-binding protein
MKRKSLIAIIDRACRARRLPGRFGRTAAPFKGIGLAGMLFAFGASSLAGAQNLTLGGTGGDLGTMKLLGEAYEKSHPGVTVRVLPSLGSGGGIKAVLAGAIDLSISSRPLKDKEREMGARSSPYSKTGLVFAVPKRAPYQTIKTSQVLDMFTANEIHWPDGTPVRLVLRPPTDGDFRILASSIDGMDAALAAASQRGYLPVAASDQETAETIENLPGGLGFISLSLILTENRSLRPLALDGIVASSETIAAGTYPISKTFYLVTGPAVSDLASDFVGFVSSPEGIDILRRTGHADITIEFAQR